MRPDWDSGDPVLKKKKLGWGRERTITGTAPHLPADPLVSLADLHCTAQQQRDTSQTFFPPSLTQVSLAMQAHSLVFIYLLLDIHL